jgi:hypothetical protein
VKQRNGKPIAMGMASKWFWSLCQKSAMESTLSNIDARL